MSSPRKKEVSIYYNGIDAGKDLSPYLSNFKYTDAVDESDTMSMTLTDRDIKWSRNWMPNKEDRIQPTITLENWNYEGERMGFHCGDFLVDDFSFSAPPLICEINGVSAPVNTDFKESKRTKTWEAATVRLIAQEISGRYSLQLQYDSVKDINIAKMEQNEQPDSEFLLKLCEKYGLGMKVYASRLIIWSFEEYFEKPHILTITKDMVSKWSYKSSIQGTYTGARVTYTSPNNKKGIEITVGKEGRLCAVNQKADNEADARLIGENAIRNANRKENTMNITLALAKLSIVATSNIAVSGFGRMDGKYFVEKVSHSLSQSSYVIQLNLSRIPGGEAGSESGSGSGSGSSPPSGEYTTKSGDTLWALAKQFYGDSSKYTQIYEANSENIEQMAKQHGKANSGGGNWIWPGMVLTIPGGGNHG